MSQLKRFANYIGGVNAWVAKYVCLLFIPLTAIVGYEVAMRYFFNRPTIWSWDVSVQLGVLLIVFGGGYALSQNRHVSVDLLVSRLSPKRRAVVNMVTAPFYLFSLGILSWYSTVVAWGSVLQGETYTSLWNPPLYPLRVMVAVAIFLFFMQGVANFIHNLSTLAHREKEKPLQDANEK